MAIYLQKNEVAFHGNKSSWKIMQEMKCENKSSQNYLKLASYKNFYEIFQFKIPF